MFFGTPNEMSGKNILYSNNF